MTVITGVVDWTGRNSTDCMESKRRAAWSFLSGSIDSQFHLNVSFLLASNFKPTMNVAGGIDDNRYNTGAICRGLVGRSQGKGFDPGIINSEVLDEVLPNGNGAPLRELQLIFPGPPGPGPRLDHHHAKRRGLQKCSDVFQGHFLSQPGAVWFFKELFSIECELPDRRSRGKPPGSVVRQLGGVEITSLLEEPLDKRV